MSKYQQTLDQYNGSKAAKYDLESKIIRGDRDRHLSLLHEVMEYLIGEIKISNLIELACGTGFFTRFIADNYKDLDIVAFDGSMEMIDQAKKIMTLRMLLFFNRFSVTYHGRNYQSSQMSCFRHLRFIIYRMKINGNYIKKYMKH